MWKKIALITILTTATLQLTAQTQTLDDRVKRARAMLLDKNFKGALAEFDKVLAADPTHLEARIDRLKALKALKMDGELQKFSKRSKSNSAQDHILDAQLSMVNRKMPDAEASLKQAMNMDKKAYMAPYMMGVIQKIKKNPNGAITHFKTAITANAKFPESYYELGDIYYAQGNTGQAVTYWKKYIDLIPRTGKRYQYVNTKLRQLGGS